jgi:hypothetical protein
LGRICINVLARSEAASAEGEKVGADSTKNLELVTFTTMGMLHPLNGLGCQYKSVAVFIM